MAANTPAGWSADAQRLWLAAWIPRAPSLALPER
jgi:hypothetical protein